MQVLLESASEVNFITLAAKNLVWNWMVFANLFYIINHGCQLQLKSWTLEFESILFSCPKNK